MPLLNRRQLGWMPNPDDARDRDFAGLMGLSAGSADQRLLDKYLDIRSQGSSSTCVGQGFAGQIQILERIAGLSGDSVSVLFMYWNSLAQHGAEGIDEGTYARTLVHALSKIGVPDEKYHPFKIGVTKKIRQPPFNAYMKAHPRRGGGYYTIKATGKARGEQIQKAILANHPVCFGTMVTRKYQDNDGPLVVEAPQGGDEIAGGHLQLCTGFMRKASGETLYRVANSWGRDWRDQGFCWFTEEYMCLPTTRDLTIYLGWDRIRNR